MGNHKNKNEELKKFLEHPIVSSVIAAVIVGIVTSVINMWTTSNKMTYEMEEVRKDISGIQDDIDDLQTNNTGITNSIAGIEASINGYEARFNTIDYRLNTIDNTLLNKPVSLYIIPSVASGMTIENYTQETIQYESPIFLSTPSWKDTDIIAIDMNSGSEYTASELVNQKLFFTYEENGQIVLFYGQFNEQNQWEGSCLMNVYQDNRLLIITDAIYHNGEIQSYKQIIPEQKNNEKIWIVSDRTCEGNVNIGDTWVYARENDYNVTFDLNNATSEDIMTYEKVKADINTTMLSEYHGCTSDGFYNDTSGESYYISFAGDGTVKTLYEGNFVNGKFSDSTGNAWYITKENDTPYMYYKGHFADNTAVNNDGCDFKYDISHEDIENIIKDKGYASDLLWLQD